MIALARDDFDRLERTRSQRREVRRRRPVVLLCERNPRREAGFDAGLEQRVGQRVAIEIEFGRSGVGTDAIEVCSAALTTQRSRVSASTVAMLSGRIEV